MILRDRTGKFYWASALLLLTIIVAGFIISRSVADANGFDYREIMEQSISAPDMDEVVYENVNGGIDSGMVEDSWGVGDYIDTGETIDVMVVYTPYTAYVAGGEDNLHQRIENAISEANDANAQSGVIFTFNLIHMVEVNYQQTFPYDLSRDLNAVRSEDGVIDEVLTLRNQYGADLVTLWLPHKSSAAPRPCGRAAVMHEVSLDFAPLAYSVVQYDCAIDFMMMAHEMGHNMGLAHDIDNANVEGSATDAYGHRVPGEFRTIMAYPCINSLPDCPQANHWSNPDVRHQGALTGIDDVSNNVRVLNENAPTVANFRDSSTSCHIEYLWTPRPNMNDRGRLNIRVINTGSRNVVGMIVNWSQSNVIELDSGLIPFSFSTIFGDSMGMSISSSNPDWGMLAPNEKSAGVGVTAIFPSGMVTEPDPDTFTVNGIPCTSEIDPDDWED